MEKDLTYAIKQKITIEDVISEYIVLDKNNKSVCPFHDEKKPSFSVNAQGQYFHCFGCGVGGDVIRFVELYNKVTFKEALQSLADKVGMKIENLDDAEIQAAQNKRTQSDILSETAQYYHTQITPEIRQYLIHERGLNDETISNFCIGYANGGLRIHLESKGFSFEVCKKSGVLRDDGKDFFYKSIIFPYFKQGRVELLRCRKMQESGENKYLSLKGWTLEMYNVSDLNDANEVIIAEGEFDTLILKQLGYKAVGIPGAGSFKEKWVSKFNNCKTIFLALDADDAGNRASGRIAEVLGEKAKIISLPQGQDITDYFLNGKSSDDFGLLINDAKTRLQAEIETISTLPKNQRPIALMDLMPSISNLNAFYKSYYKNLICDTLKIGKRDFDRELQAVQSAVKAPPTNSELTVKVEKYEMSEGERKEAMDVLSDENLLEKYLSDCEKLNCVGEEDNKLILLLAMTSRILEEPINIIVKGESSSGKSYTVNTVKQFIPPEDVLEFTTMSPRALYHRKDKIAHKLLLMHERVGAENVDYSLRILQSEKVLKFSTAVKEENSNMYQTKDIEVEGPIAYVETTTKTHIHLENETRCFSIYPDESKEQTNRIFAQQNKIYSGEFNQYSRETVLLKWQNAQRLLKAYPVRIPYVNLLEFPKEPLRARRDYLRFLSIISANANLHQFQRVKTNENGKVFLYADFNDYTVAYTLGQKLLASTVSGIGLAGEKLFEAIWSVASDKAKTEDRHPHQINLLSREIENAICWTRVTVTKHLASLEHAGYIDIHRQGQGKASLIRVLKEPGEPPNILLSPEQLIQRYEQIHEPSNLPSSYKTNNMQDKGLLLNKLGSVA